MARKAPNQDKEIILGVMEAFHRITENEEEERLLREQFVKFYMKKGNYSRTTTQFNVVTIDETDCWATYGSENLELADVAKRVLQPISSSSVERNWSTYSYTITSNENRLNSKRADKLIFIHSNIRLQSFFQNHINSCPTKSRT